MPTRRRALSGCGPQAGWLCCSLLTYHLGYRSSLASRQRAWGPAAKCQVILARALKESKPTAGRVSDPRRTILSCQSEPPSQSVGLQCGDLAGPTAQPSRAEEDSEFTKDARRTWARLLAKIFEADPLLCPRCGREMKIVNLIDSTCPAVERILRHLKLWDRPERPPPPPVRTLCYDLDEIDFDDTRWLVDRSE